MNSLLLLSIGLCLLICCFCCQSVPELTDGGKTAQIDSLMQAYHHDGVFSATVLVADGEELIYKAIN